MHYAYTMPEDVFGLSMHGTGTALGDPIEVGAASSVYGKESTRWFAFMASKSWAGHGEPAAGMAGLLLATESLNASGAIQLLHLRKVNDYVAASVGEAYILPRQAGVQPHPSGGSLGVSAFAFQGTNAHAVIGKGTLSHPISSSLILKKQRQYVVPEMHVLLSTIIKSETTVVFESALDSSAQSYLWDHMVMDRSILPGMRTYLVSLYHMVIFSKITLFRLSGAGYFEASLAGARILCLEDCAAVGSLHIPAPLVLSIGSDIILQTRVDLRDGIIQIQSRSSGGVQVHVRGQATRIKHSLESNVWSKPSATSVLLGHGKQAQYAAVCQMDSETRRGGLYLDPAVFDSFLQVGQVFISGSEVYVPACLGMLLADSCARNLTHEKDRAWGVALPLPSNESMISDFRMTSVDNNSICSLKQLEAKSMVGGTPVALPKVLKMESERSLYQTMVVAFEPEQFTPGPHVFEKPFKQNDYPVQVASSALEGIQSLASSLASNISLRTMGMPVGGVAPIAPKPVQDQILSLSALGGYIRTLSQEMPNISWSAQYQDGIDIASKGFSLRTDEAVRGDAFGSMLSSHVEHRPLLQDSMAEDILKPYQLLPLPRGSLSSMAPQPLETNNIPQDSVLVAVKAVGINFRDVLNVLGMYPGDPGDPGGDCAGILEIGEIYHDGKVVATRGDAVFGLAGGCLGSHVIVSNHTVVPMPANISFSEASTMPTVFVTVDTALNRIARIRSGDKVLVHAAAGGVGLAAMQVIESLGCEPVVTAGNVSKRSMLRGIGVKHSFSSRDLMFSEESVSCANGASVAINTLTSSGFVACTLATLSHGGRFIEISKRDIWSANRVLQERPDISYNLLAVDFMSAEALHKALMRVAMGVSSNELRPLPLVSHQMSAVVEAFRQMSQARHIGKIVVRPISTMESSAHLRSSLISGGTGRLCLYLLRSTIAFYCFSVFSAECIALTQEPLAAF